MENPGDNTLPHTHRDMGTRTHLEVLLKHGQFELLGAFRIIRIQHDRLAHQISCKDADTVLTLGANWLSVLEELLSQLVHLKQGDR